MLIRFPLLHLVVAHGVLVVAAGALWPADASGQLYRSTPIATPVPHIPTITPTPALGVIRALELPAGIPKAAPLETTPDIRRAPPITVVVPPRTPEKSKSEDCSVKELNCAQTCEPSSRPWPSYRGCLVNQCEIKEENCLAKLVDGFRARGGGESTVTFKIKSETSYNVQVGFFSQNRTLSWPGNGRAYDVNDYNTHSYTLSCSPNEKICYGAWATRNASTYWGVGPDDRHTCSNCCAVCNGGSVSHVLVE